MRILRPGTRPPWAIAHRGASSSHPENTIAAFGAALEQRCDGIELDVQLSADGVPFVYHDRTLAKIGGGRRRLATLNSAELARQDAGAWFEPRFRGERIPTLRSVLERYARRTTLLVELKVRERHRERGGHEQLALSVAALVRSLRLEERLFVLSFDRDTLEIATRRAPRLRTVWNLRAPQRVTSGLRRRMHPVFGVSVDVRTLSHRLVAAAHELGKPALAFTCNTPQSVHHARECGADAIMSDRPAWLRRQLERPPAVR